MKWRSEWILRKEPSTYRKQKNAKIHPSLSITIRKRQRFASSHRGWESCGPAGGGDPSDPCGFASGQEQVKGRGRLAAARPLHQGAGNLRRYDVSGSSCSWFSETCISLTVKKLLPFSIKRGWVVSGPENGHRKLCNWSHLYKVTLFSSCTLPVSGQQAKQSQSPRLHTPSAHYPLPKYYFLQSL